MRSRSKKTCATFWACKKPRSWRWRTAIRKSGKLCAVSVHVAPGLGNAMGMLYDARKAGAPPIVTAGQHPQSFSFSEPLLWAELPEPAQPLVKWPAEVRRLEDLPKAIHRAAKAARTADRTGVSFTTGRRLSQYDLLISLGADLFTLSLPAAIDALPDGMTIVHIDTDPWELGKNYAVRAAIFGEPKVTLPELTSEIGQHMDAAARERAQARAEFAGAEIRKEREALHAAARAAAGNNPIDPSALVAIGVKMALPKRPVVALVGDGSATYTIQALWTAAHERLGVTFVIFKNTSCKILKQRVRAMEGDTAQTNTYVGMNLHEPAIDFVGLARSMGVTAERTTDVAIAS